jgi:hypothetical protein
MNLMSVSKCGALAVLTAATVLISNTPAAFADPNCDKNCGQGPYVTSGFRGCSTGDCIWAQCELHRDACGYPDDYYNDWCIPSGTPVFVQTLCS